MNGRDQRLQIENSDSSRSTAVRTHEATFYAPGGAYEIKAEYVAKLRQLEAFEIFIIADDSGSMATVLENTGGDPYAKAMSRWDELARSVSIIIELASCFDKSGVDVYFLNRAPILGVTSAQQVQVAFQYPPQGYTPIVRTMNSVLAANRQKFGEKKCLLVLLTDGEPTDDNGQKDLKNFDVWMSAKPKGLHVSLVACTDNPKEVQHLEKHQQGQNCVMIDDFRTEQQKVAKNNNKQSFSFGDYICKLLLGSIDNDMKNLGKSKGFFGLFK